MNWKRCAFPVAIHTIPNGHHGELDGGNRGQSNEQTAPAPQEPTACKASGSCVRRRWRRSVSR